MKKKLINLIMQAWEKVSGTEPDYTELINKRVAMIEASIEKSKTYQELQTCKNAVTVLLTLPFPVEAARQTGSLNSKIGWKEFELRMQSYDNLLKNK